MKKTQGMTHQSRVRKVVVGGLIGATSLAFGLGIVGPTSDADAAVVCDGPLLNSGTTCQAYSGDCWQFATPEMYCYDHMVVGVDGGSVGSIDTVGSVGAVGSSDTVGTIGTIGTIGTATLNHHDGPRGEMLVAAAR